MSLDRDKIRQIVSERTTGSFYNLFREFERSKDRESITRALVLDLVAGDVPDEAVPIIVDLIFPTDLDMNDHYISMLLDSSIQPEVVVHVLWRLQGSGRETFIPLIGNLLKISESPSIKIFCLYALVFFDSDYAIELIKSAKDDRTYDSDRFLTIGQLSSQILEEKSNKIS